MLRDIVFGGLLVALLSACTSTGVIDPNLGPRVAIDAVCAAQGAALGLQLAAGMPAAAMVNAISAAAQQGADTSGAVSACQRAAGNLGVDLGVIVGHAKAKATAVK